MAKKKTTKKPVSKRVAKTPRTTRATIDQRNETLGKPCGHRSKTVVTPPPAEPVAVQTTYEPAIEVVNRMADRIDWQLKNATHENCVSATVDYCVEYPPAVEYTKVNRKAHRKIAGIDSYSFYELICNIKQFRTKKIGDALGNLAFKHPLFFGTAVCVFLFAVSAAVAGVMRYFRL